MPVIKIVELIGSSEKGWEEAVQEALREAAKTVKNIVGLDVVGHKADVRDNRIEVQGTCQDSFRRRKIDAN